MLNSHISPHLYIQCNYTTILYFLNYSPVSPVLMLIVEWLEPEPVNLRFLPSLIIPLFYILLTIMLQNLKYL